MALSSDFFLFTTHLRQVHLRSTCKSTSSAQASILTHNKRDVATSTGHVTAIHDPTEGGLAGALDEMARASKTSEIDYFYDVSEPIR